jgi:lysophospholipase L1-like esterase
MLDVLYHANRIVVPYEPASILLYEGDNDIASGMSAHRVSVAFHALTEIVHAALPETNVFVLSIKPTVARRDFWPEMREANRLLREACDGDPRLAFLDVAARMLDAGGEPRPDLLVEDGLHLNAAGYAIWREEVRKALFGESGRR